MFFSFPFLSFFGFLSFPSLVSFPFLLWFIMPLPPHLLSSEYLQECFTYHSAGILTWNKRPKYHFKEYRSYTQWNQKHPEQQADTLVNLIPTVTINGRKISAASVVWCFHAPPSHPLKSSPTFSRPPTITHLNSISSDNRIENLTPGPSTRISFTPSPEYRYIYFHDAVYSRFAVCAAIIEPEYIFQYTLNRQTANQLCHHLNSLFAPSVSRLVP